MTYRHLIAALVASCLLGAALLAQDQDKTAEKKITNPLGKDKAAIAAGREQFGASCGACHGSAGQGGRGPKLVGTTRMLTMEDAQMFEIIRGGVKGTPMPPFALPDKEVWQLVSFVRSLNGGAIDQDVPGDLQAGEALFFGTGQCSKCHMIRGRGGLLGPDLSNIGSSRPVEKIKESLIDPNANIEPGFAAVTAKMLDGRSVSGVAKNFSNYSVQIMDEQGNFHFFLKKDLKELIYRKKSLMPPASLPESELQNLLAFLSRQSLQVAEKSNKIEHGKEVNP